MPACLQIRKPASYSPTRPSRPPSDSPTPPPPPLSSSPFPSSGLLFRVFCLSPNSLLVSPLSKNTEPRYRPIIFPPSSPPFASRGLQGKSIASKLNHPTTHPSLPSAIFQVGSPSRLAEKKIADTANKEAAANCKHRRSVKYFGTRSGGSPGRREKKRKTASGPALAAILSPTLSLSLSRFLHYSLVSRPALTLPEILALRQIPTQTARY